MRIFLTTLMTVGLIPVNVYAETKSRIEEGVIENSEVITTQVGKNGRPLLGAAVGVGVGSAFGSGSGKDAAKIAGGILGAARQAKKTKRVLYGWRYTVTIDDTLQVVDAWCAQPNEHCSGVPKGSEVYIIDRNSIEQK